MQIANSKRISDAVNFKYANCILSSMVSGKIDVDNFHERFREI